eukprot:UN3075
MTFSKVVSAFSGGHKLRSVQKQLCPGADFGKAFECTPDADFSSVLEWFVAEGLVVQLASYYHFLPCRARSGAPANSSGVNVNTKIRREFCPHYLSEDELQLLAARAKDGHQHLFLCRFVVDFARAHCRTDDSRFAGFAAHFFERQAEAEELFRKNRDIFVQYVCRC